MSWGYLVDLNIEVTPRAWTALQAQTLAEHPLAADWTGFREKGLAAAFAPPATRDAKATFRKVLAWPVFKKECLREEKRTAKRIKLRVALILDKSQLDMASYLGALLEGVRAAGGEGSLQIVNDGSYGGESGRVLTVKGGKRSARVIKDAWSIIEKVGAQVYPEAFAEDEDADEVEADDKPPPAPQLPSPDHAHYSSVALYNAGDINGARACLADYFAAGGTARWDLLTNYTIFLRTVPPKGKALQAAQTTVLNAFRDDPALLANLPLLQDAVAFLNESGRAKESIELVFTALDRGTPWSVALATNVTNSAGVANKAALTDRLLARLDLDQVEPSGQLMHNIASLHVQRKRPDEAFAALARSLELEPARKKDVVDDRDLRPLHRDPRWAQLTTARRPRRR